MNHTALLYQAPALTDADRAALARIRRLHTRLRAEVGSPKRWTGTVQNVLAAQSIRNSTKVEGYEVTAEQALGIMRGDADDESGSDVHIVDNYRRP